LRYLPYLLPVVAGHLRLIGEEPFESNHPAPSEEKSEIVRDRGDFGLSGLMRSTSDEQVAVEQLKVPRASLRRPLAQ
jgi:hypothetical protein